MRSSAAAAAAALVAGVAAGAAPGFRPAPPDHRWEFPRDHRAHPGFRDEWWYFTGVLASDDRRFGYQLTFFRVGLVPERPALDSGWAAADAVMAHLAVTDLSSGAHVFSEVLWRAVPPLGGFAPSPDPLLAWARAPPGSEGRWTLSLERGTFRLAAADAGRGIALDLAAVASKPVALQGPNGWSRKSVAEGYASLYASITRLATSGTIAAGGRVHRVRGESWMDHEVSSSPLAPDQVGWDWFGLRLDDGRDLMLYLLRRADGAIDHATGTLVARDGAVTVLGPGAFTVRALGRWRSPVTGAEYPSGWTVEVPGAVPELRVEPEVRAAENVSALARGLFYWEGPVRTTDAAGRRTGEGYVELTGRGAGSRPPL
jgi:predicted secreted hydrolase